MVKNKEENKYGKITSNGTPSNVIELGSQHFKPTNEVGELQLVHSKTTGKYGILKCYAPWCGHCLTMVNDLEFLAKELPKLGKPFFVAAVNCTNKQLGNDVLARKLNVGGFPTLFFVNMDGGIEDFNPESRNIDGLLKELCKSSKKYNSEICKCSYSNNKLNC